MILGIGIDIVDIKRVERLVRKYGERFTRRIFTAQEREICLPRANRYECLAARFAAKEAVMKGLGTGYSNGVRFADIEVCGGEGQRPRVALHGTTRQVAESLGVTGIHVSLAHERDYAIAFVVIEGH